MNNNERYKKKGRFQLIIIAAILFFSMVGVFFFFKSLSITNNLSYSLYDYFIEKKTESIEQKNDIVMITIDDQSIREFNRLWPWPRAYHAGLISKLTEMGAKVIAYDISFTESGVGDTMLAEKIKEHGAVVLPKLNVFSTGGVTPFDKTASFGHLEVNIDSDGVVRSINPYLNGMPSFSFAILNILDELKHSDNSPVNSYKNISENPIQFVYSTRQNYPVYSFSDVYMGKIDHSEFKDKIVFVGVTATGIGERLRSSSLSSSKFQVGVELQVSIFEALREGATTEYSGIVFNVMVALVSILVVVALAMLAPPLVTIGALLLYIVFLTCLTFLLFYFHNYWYSPIALFFSMISVVFIFTIVRIQVSLKEANRALVARLNELDKALTTKSVEDMYAEIGSEKCPSSFIINRLEAHGMDVEKQFKHSHHTEDNAKAIDDVEGKKIVFGNCCYPIPGDSIMGYSQPRQNELIVHRTDCEVAIEASKNTDRCYVLAWNNLNKSSFPVQLCFVIRNLRGVMAEVTTALLNMDININDVLSQTINEEYSRLWMIVHVPDRDYLASIFRNLKKIKNIVRVGRKNDEVQVIE